MVPNNFLELAEISGNTGKNARDGQQAGLLPLLSQVIFFEEGLRQAKCHVVAQTRGYHKHTGLSSDMHLGYPSQIPGGGIVLKFDALLCLFFSLFACKQ